MEEMSSLKWRVRQQNFTGAWGRHPQKFFPWTKTPISREYSMFKVHWGVTFKKTGNKLIEFDVTYFIQKNRPRAKNYHVHSSPG